MAEAYAKSLLPADSDVKVSSSGIEANLALNGDADPVAVDALEKENIKQYLAHMWQQTTQQMLDEANVLVFMSNTVYEDARSKFDIEQDKSIVWHIDDVDDIYHLVKREVDDLIKGYV